MGKRKRYLSPHDTVTAWMNATRSELAFDGKTVDDWRTWRRKFRARLVKNLGPMPKKVPLRAEVIRKEDKVIMFGKRLCMIPKSLRVCLLMC